VRFGPPLAPPTDANDSRALRTYTREIMAAMADLLPPEMRAAEQNAAAVADPGGDNEGANP
jgi:hypothetical protein